MSAAAPMLDPLIAEAKLRMRRRRVLTAVLVLLAGAGVLFLILRPSGVPGATRVTSHGRNGSGKALAQLKVPVDAAEREWRSGIQRASNCACGLTAKGVLQVHRRVVSAAHKSGATVVRLRVWVTPETEEVVLATRMPPAEYLSQRLPRLVRLLGRDSAYVKVVNARGSSIFELSRFPRQRTTGPT